MSRKPKNSCEAFGKYVARQVRQLSRELPEVKAGRDEEAVHRTRVACRRLRVALKYLRQILPEKLTKGWKLGKLRRQIRDLARALGEVRDLDVQIARFKTGPAKDVDKSERPGLRHLLKHLQTLRRQRLRAAQQAIKEFAQSKVLSRLRKWVGELRRKRIRRKDSELIAAEGEKLLKEKLSTVLGHVDNLRQTRSHEELHAFRISVKRLRYALELWEDLSPKQLETAIKRCRSLQELLGEICDNFVAATLIERTWEELSTGGIKGGNSTELTKLKAGFDRCLRWCREQRETSLDRLEAFLREAGSAGYWDEIAAATDVHKLLGLSVPQGMEPASILRQTD